MIDWSTAPMAAQWHTTDCRGSTWWFCEPHLIGDIWCWRDQPGECEDYDYERKPISIEQRQQEIQDTYKRIVRIIDDACADAKKNEPPIRGAINWGDLGCADVGIKNDGYYAVIEEADPSTWELRQFVYDRLVAAGFGNVDVTTEW